MNTKINKYASAIAILLLSCQISFATSSTIIKFKKLKSINSNKIKNGLVDFSKLSESPSLIFSLEELQTIRNRSLITGWPLAMRKAMIKDAETYMKDYEMLPFKINRPGKYSNLSCGRALGSYVINLAFCGYLTGEKRYIDRAKQILISAVELTIPGSLQDNDVKTPIILKSIEDNKNGIPVKWTTHLQCGDAAHSIALGYDLLHPFMNKKEKELVKKELKEYAEWLSLESSAKGYYNFSEAPSACNHTTVHFGPLGLIGLILGNEQWVNTAANHISAYFRFAADNTGYVMEGHSYQSYGLSGAAPLTYALKRNGIIDLYNVPQPTYKKGLPQFVDWEKTNQKWNVKKNRYNNFCKLMGDQLLWKMLPSGKHVVSMNDSRDEPSGEGAALPPLISRNAQQLWAWLENSGYNRNHEFAPQHLGSAYMRPYLFLVAEPIMSIRPTEKSNGLSHFFSSGRVFARSGWNSSEDAYFAFTSGYDAHHGHNHEDENNIVFSALGEQFLFDARYEAKYSGFHSLVEVGKYGETSDIKENALKIRGTRGDVQCYNQRNYGVFVRGEAKGAYDKRANVSSSNRKALFVTKSKMPFLVYRDDVLLSQDSNTFTIHYVTTKENGLNNYQDKKGVVINGSENGGKALIIAFNGEEQLTLAEDNLNGKEFIKSNNGNRVIWDKLIRRISGTTHKSNHAEIVSFIFPFKSSYELPQRIIAKRMNGKLYYDIVFENGNIIKVSTCENDIDLTFN